ncbi:hypothetical protein HSB1_31620 [Halogranum salarium B-1]|uniref:Uncharacterized protein n=1 Tax=Halogranum salarium B-1 TaxID=1210908 RepID=J3JEV2_9EURY|nr:hypothetical protein HSB1_31620 [Halogranum salarium B-1]
MFRTTVLQRVLVVDTKRPRRPQSLTAWAMSRQTVYYLYRSALSSKETK